MLVFSKMNLADLVLSFDPLEDYKKKISKLPDFLSLKENIQNQGMLDPLLVIRYPDRYQVETGTRRLMIARELKISPLDCFIYDKKGGEIEFNKSSRRIGNAIELSGYFRNEEVHCYLDILGYLKDGTIQL